MPRKKPEELEASKKVDAEVVVPASKAVSYTHG